MIDELNIISYDKVKIEKQLRSYFQEMPQISEKQVEERVDIAKKIFDLIMLFMFMVGGTEELGQIQDIDYYISMIIRRYEDAVDEDFGLDLFMASYISQFAQNTVNTTLEHRDEEYYLSEDRCLIIAENEANTTLGHIEYERAIKNGCKSKKWLTEKDSRVRKTHTLVDETTIGIKEYFHVGSSLMLYPHDVRGEAKEVIGCRCHVEYLQN